MNSQEEENGEGDFENLTEEEIMFRVNMNNILGNIPIHRFRKLTKIISQSLFVLQKEGLRCNIFNIYLVANKIVQKEFLINRAEIISMLYYLECNTGVVTMEMEPTGMPTWGINQEAFDKLVVDPSAELDSTNG
jgi:hypothetical protein|uniref:Uncharacterized protein n=1 Tax=viral metagenome TaxID=1070528 RepID=A0A6C0BMJ4_9ZZZZ